MKTPYYPMVPKDLKVNLKFRLAMIKWGSEDPANANALWFACSKDMLFWINTFCFTFDPRKTPSALPFITWNYQDDCLRELWNSVGKRDILIEKSRDMGASWMPLLVMAWYFQFKELQSFLLVSRKEDYVDKSDDPDSLMWKVDFIHSNQPGWLLPNITRNKLMITNNDNKSTIAGDSTTGDVARGGRRTAILLDEFASVPNDTSVLSSTADATKCRMFVSTPKGVANEFYKYAHSETKKISLHWTLHPEKLVGLYVGSDGLPHSPWYDEECKRRGYNAAEIGQELNIDYLGSDYQFFDSVSLDQVNVRYGREPLHVGEVIFDPQTLDIAGFVEGAGRLNLWIPVDPKSEVVCADYVFGVDTATGTGASNSVISVGNRKTGEKVAEFVSPKIMPHELARMAFALSKFFKTDSGLGPFMIWESNGPGRIFGDIILELGYRNIYYKQKENTLTRRPTDIPGFHKSVESGLSLLSEYRRALSCGDFINRSRESIRECREYVFLQNGTVEHCRATGSTDPSGARANHGDRVIADALCWRGIKEFGTQAEEAIVTVPVGCLAWRKDRVKKEELAAKDSW